MKNSAVALALTAILAASPSMAAEAWKVVEGPRGTVKGMWRVEFEGDRISGAADMFGAQGQSSKYRLAGKLEAGVYTAQRLSPSDGVMCMYRGAKRLDGAIAGTAICGGQSGPWTAEPVKNK
jgi:hypothetical protein